MSRGRRWVWLAIGLVVAAAIVVGLAVWVQPAAAPSAEERARAIAAELRCPDCAGLSVADSPTQAADEIRRQIDEQVAAGRTDEQIKASFVARYGEWILLTPPGPAPWLVPLLVTAAGAGVLGWWLLGRPVPAAAQAGATVGGPPPAPSLGSRAARRASVTVAAALAAAVGIGYLLPEPWGLAARTVVNQPLAEAQAAEAARQANIERLLAELASDPTNTAALSDLADAYLAGTKAEDLQRAAIALIALIGLDPGDTSSYWRLISAYIRADDWTDAAAATEALAELAPDSPEVPFFRGLIAWRGHGDAATAIPEFDQFLEMAPDDPRVPMIRALRQEAAAADGAD